MHADLPCMATGLHMAECLDCHQHAEVGWAHLCLPCWEAHEAACWANAHLDGSSDET